MLKISRCIRVIITNYIYASKINNAVNPYGFSNAYMLLIDDI